jgi:hypothetical protein
MSSSAVSAPFTKNGLTASGAPLESAGQRAAIIRLGTALIAFVYVLQALSPMRLDNDSVVYLTVASDLAQGNPIHTTGLPVGYSAFIALLDILGIAKSFVFVLANCAFIMTGVFLARWIYRQEGSRNADLIVPLSLLAVSIIHTLPLHLPEAMFLATSLGALACMTEASRSAGTRRAAFFGLALVLTSISVVVRLAGFALLPALLWTSFAHGKRATPWTERTPRQKWVVYVIAVMIALVSVGLIGSFRKYMHEAGMVYLSDRPFSKLALHAFGIARAFGEIFFNLPAKKFGVRGAAAFGPAGALAALFLASSIRIRKPATPSGIYLLSFIVMLVIWPYSASRLWLPIVPLLIGHIIGAEYRFSAARISRIGKAYMAWFIFAGMAALFYTSRITFSGRDFPHVYGRNGGMSDKDPATGKVNELHNSRARALMKRYGNPFVVYLPGRN